jgi:hypothetical protein
MLREGVLQLKPLCRKWTLGTLEQSGSRNGVEGRDRLCTFQGGRVNVTIITDIIPSSIGITFVCITSGQGGLEAFTGYHSV